MLKESIHSFCVLHQTENSMNVSLDQLVGESSQNQLFL